MCLFTKKKTNPVIGKYSIGEYVHFRYRNELMFGYIYRIKKDMVGKTIYDIQLGGQCPGLLENISEDNIFIKKKK